ncbi:ketopantoate reductase [Nocardioides terrae]|uniref:2-dehydropantoate 2-reductase n=1 Tax=Nocardioides terrae TaxID=574651 RepID=A0A1I1NRK4_9ACTN|nr:2-dehydropantoate 2-reductase [Nocardioides terrae]SFD00259.1 ketopantoate reductase [Nocardioides terrae]
MRIGIIGAGGVGGYFGAQLAAHGQDVTFVARGRHLEAMRTTGLRIESESAPAHLFPVDVTDSVEELGDVDVAAIGVKLWDTDEIGRRLGPHLRPDATVLSLQNGVNKDDILRAYLPAQTLIGAVCYISAKIAAPGIIKHDGTLARMVLGEFDGRCTERTMRLFEAFIRAGVDAELSTSMSEVVWKKFVFLVGLSSVTSATRQPVGVLRRRERTRQLLHDAMDEVVRVARARGIRLPSDFAGRQMEFVDTLPPGMTSSMLNDLLHGQRLELPWLGQSVVAMARELGVPTPVNDLLAAVLDPYVEGAS